MKKISEKLSLARGEDVSDFVRRAIKMELARLFVSDAEEKKALGFKAVGYE